VLAAAAQEVARLRAAAVAADAALPPAKRQRHALLPWEEATAGWDLQRWQDLEKSEQVTTGSGVWSTLAPITFWARACSNR